MGSKNNPVEAQGVLETVEVRGQRPFHPGRTTYKGVGISAGGGNFDGRLPSENPPEPPRLTSETEMPPNPSRTTIGVGERFTIMSDKPVIWSVFDGNLADIHTQNKNEIKLLALDKTGVLTVTARDTETELSTSIRFNIIRPSGLKFVLWETTHIYNLLDAGFVAKIYLQPATVNFYRLKLSELQSYAIGTGLFSDLTGSPHGHRGYTKGRSEWHGAESYDAANGTLMIHDTVYGQRHRFCPEKIIPSTLQYTIPFEWLVAGIDKIHHLETVSQSTVIDEKGYITTSKGGVSVTFHYKDKSKNENLYERIPEPENNC